MKSASITREEWERKGEELFGANKVDWRFKCPACGHVASVAIAREKYQDVRGKGWRPESECIGRYTDAVLCDWAAYGLFRGPVFVETTETRSIAVFDFDGEPFTGAIEAPTAPDSGSF